MSVRPPSVLSEIPGLVLETFGLHVNVLSELESYDDRNILVEADPNQPLPDQISATGQTKFVVKILNATDSKHPELIDIQNAMMVHLKEAGFPTPGPVLNLHRRYQSSVVLDQLLQEKHVFRMLEFAPGVTLDKVSLTKDLCREIGQLGGRLDSVLKNFPVEEYSAIDRMRIHWHLSETHFMRARLHYVTDSHKLCVMTEVLTEFETKVLQKQSSFTKGLIHCDMNDCNIIVTPKGKDEPQKHQNGTQPDAPTTQKGDYTVSGLIDFGDCTHSLYIFEVAISMCYVMINRDNIDPMEAAAAVYAGYSEHMTLSRHELLHLRLSICTRMVQSIVIGLAAKATDETNDYAQLHSLRFWPMLESLWSMSDEKFLERIV